jgi:hypothetical protein
VKSISTNQKKLNLKELSFIAFYAITGIILLSILPVTRFPPHVGLIAILSLITAYSFFTKRPWTIWLVTINFVVVSTFALFTLYSIGLTDIVISLSLIAYTLLTWIVTIRIAVKRELN